MKSDLELPLYAIASIFTLEFFTGWAALVLTVILIIVGVARLIQWIKTWNYETKRRKEEEEKRTEEREEHELRMKLLQKELEEKERRL
ncbi:MAG: hypothetical protein GDA51_02735 [Ekhidna sp.]|nr:hypothetical protein [Ekhidna sp.]